MKGVRAVSISGNGPTNDEFIGSPSVVFISREGMVQRTSVRGISRYGRMSQGVRVMNIRDDDVVSAVALVMESEPEVAQDVAEPVDGVQTELLAEPGDHGTASESNGAAPDPADDGEE